MVGPVVGGHVTDAYGFPAALLLMASALGLVALIMMGLFFKMVWSHTVSPPPAEAIEEAAGEDRDA